ncbi:hypothetical protein THAOC_19952 [Thalassiosira oceanica]|uniref:B30.2/SPRY domain-containing protein n=1 Tax=Thalassiosira oceanica TaxID=159749 RepID=K0S178_THAOC|nr:hypothetical protein THAOC_19952 [Thalassiosira oceanica]|eukprot:EJK59788.1 hypothetical protein THAOC_19952 [Thalassiosira oceanica]
MDCCEASPHDFPAKYINPERKNPSARGYDRTQARDVPAIRLRVIGPISLNSGRPPILLPTPPLTGTPQIQETSLGTPKTLPPPHVSTSSNSSDFTPQKALAPPSQLTPPDIVAPNPSSVQSRDLRSTLPPAVPGSAHRSIPSCASLLRLAADTIIRRPATPPAIHQFASVSRDGSPQMGTRPPLTRRDSRGRLRGHRRRFLVERHAVAAAGSRCRRAEETARTPPDRPLRPVRGMDSPTAGSFSRAPPASPRRRPSAGLPRAFGISVRELGKAALNRRHLAGSGTPSETTVSFPPFMSADRTSGVRPAAGRPGGTARMGRKPSGGDNPPGGLCERRPSQREPIPQGRSSVPPRPAGHRARRSPTTPLRRSVRPEPSPSTAMAEQTHSAVKRQRVAVVESALANIDVVSQLAAFLEAKDLCQVKASCKALGSASANDGAAVNGLSVTEEAARRIYEGASDEEKAMLPRYDGESWIELYYHLLMLRARLTFDQLVGLCVEYRGGNNSSVQGKRVNGRGKFGQAICGNYVMRAGKHWATFTSSSLFSHSQTVGVIRPLPGWEKRGLDKFSPGLRVFHQDLQQERTGKWGGDVHCCRIYTRGGHCHWYDWEGQENITPWKGRDDFDRDWTTLGMLLDLGDGTLSVYLDGRRVGTLKDGLAGEYCWIAGFHSQGDVSIQRGYDNT